MPTPAALGLTPVQPNILGLLSGNGAAAGGSPPQPGRIPAPADLGLTPVDADRGLPDQLAEFEQQNPPLKRFADRITAGSKGAMNAVHELDVLRQQNQLRADDAALESLRQQRNRLAFTGRKKAAADTQIADFGRWISELQRQRDLQLGSFADTAAATGQVQSVPLDDVNQSLAGRTPPDEVAAGNGSALGRVGEHIAKRVVPIFEPPFGISDDSISPFVDPLPQDVFGLMRLVQGFNRILLKGGSTAADLGLRVLQAIPAGGAAAIVQSAREFGMDDTQARRLERDLVMLLDVAEVAVAGAPPMRLRAPRLRPAVRESDRAEAVSPDFVPQAPLRQPAEPAGVPALSSTDTADSATRSTGRSAPTTVDAPNRSLAEGRAEASVDVPPTVDVPTLARGHGATVTGEGPFGPIFRLPRLAYESARDLLLRTRTGEVPAALHHPDIGDVGATPDGEQGESRKCRP